VEPFRAVSTMPALIDRQEESIRSTFQLGASRRSSVNDFWGV
jgi:hypothetical protein